MAKFSINNWSCQACLCVMMPYSCINDDQLCILHSDINENIYEKWSLCENLNSINLEINNNHDDISFKADENLNNVNSNIECNYYLDDHLNASFSTTQINSGLSIIHFNCRSLHAHFHELCTFIENTEIKFDVIAVTETWLKPNECDSLFNISGYDLYTKSRTIKSGGGVAIYVNNNLKHTVLCEMSLVIENCMESTFVEIDLKNSKQIIIGCIYRAPDTNLTFFNDNLQSLLNKVVKNNSLYLCGDFNIDLLKYHQHAQCRNFADQLFSYGLYPLITKPTRITKTSASLIDNIYTN